MFAWLRRLLRPTDAQAKLSPLTLRGEELAKFLMQPDGLEQYEAAQEARAAAGLVDGLHYTALVPAIKTALKSRDLDAAAGLLLRAADAVELEKTCASLHESPVWYHQTLASVYRKLGRSDLADTIEARLRALTSGP